jgi:predicted metal-dependent peptidase
MNDNIIAQTIVQLFESERFYAELISNMTRIYNKNIPIAGVCIRDKIELHINLENFEKLTVIERVAVLKHECEHILRNHIARSKELMPEVYKKNNDIADSIINNVKHRSLNVAADCAINGLLPNLPEGAVFPKLFELPDGEIMEWYAEQLKNNDKMNEINGIDNHELWADSDDDKEILKEKIKQHVNKAAEKTRAAGMMTHEDELKVSHFNKNLIDWKAQLNRFIAKTIESIIESSRKKRNRRYGISFPGDVKIERLRLGIAIDTSGSISDMALIQFMSEINKISQYSDVTVIEADSEIKNVYKYDPRKTYTVKGRGGTAYKPALDYFNKEKEIDAILYFGDMDNYDNEELKKPKYPVLWVIVGDSEPPANFGSQIRIKI